MATQLVYYNSEVDKSNIKGECYFPGIAYDDFDRAGNVCPWKVCRIFESSRRILVRRNGFMDFLDLNYGNKFGHFVLGAQVSFEPCLWNIFSRDRTFPFKVTSEVINLGQKSFVVKDTITNLLDNKQLATNVAKLVYIDKNTRRPQNYPSWHSLKYRNAPTNNDVNFSVDVTSVPDTAFSNSHIPQWTFVVTPSEIDSNGHTNQASYVRFFLDTVEMARCAKHLHHFTCDVCLYPITSLAIHYRKELLCGQEVTASVWESDSKPSILHFAISRGDGLAIVSTANFKDNPSSKL